MGTGLKQGSSDQQGTEVTVGSGDIEVQLKNGVDSSITSITPPLVHRVLVEIVSALYLPSTDRFSEADPYVVVFLGDHEIHRTQVVSNSRNPIWTVDTGALFLIEIPNSANEDLDSSKQSQKWDVDSTLIKFEVRDYDTLRRDDTLGEVSIRLKKLMAGQGKRKAFSIVTPPETWNKSVKRMNAHKVKSSRKVSICPTAGEMS